MTSARTWCRAHLRKCVANGEEMSTVQTGVYMWSHEAARVNLNSWLLPAQPPERRDYE